jgi:hypothetical protein
MELINATRMPAAFNMGIEPSGRELLVVVIKGTFTIPKPGEQVQLHEVQQPLVMADTFYGEPGYSATKLEVDFAPKKQRCDILLNGSAHAPGGRPATQVQVGLKVGDFAKSFNVVGDRKWLATAATVRASEPEPFVHKPFHYGVAFGGVDDSVEDKAVAYELNAIGCGYSKHLKADWLDGRPLPNTEKMGEHVISPNGAYTPMSLGVLGRAHPHRRIYCGTYNQEWLDNTFPFLPKDFDDRYYQATPEDQQITIPKRPLEVALLNLTPDGKRSFELPIFEAPVNIFPRNGEREDYMAQMDTIVFEPDEGRFTMTWRMHRPLKRSMHEIAQILVGRKGKEWWQQREEVKFPIPVVMVPMEKSADEVGV